MTTALRPTRPRRATATRRTRVDLGGGITTADVYAIAVDGRAADVGRETRRRMRASSAVRSACVEERRIVHGVATGYGPLARHHLGPEHAATLQRKLLHRFAAGVDAPRAAPTRAP